MTVDLPNRNDVDAALAAFVAEYKATKGAPDPDLCQTLIMLQDNPSAYLERVAEFLSDVGDD